MEVRSFFYAQNVDGCIWGGRGGRRIQPAFSAGKTVQMKTLEVEVVRVRITLACTECKQRNYNTTKEKKNHPERMETRKYCKFCRKHTMHKETR